MPLHQSPLDRIILHWYINRRLNYWQWFHSSIRWWTYPLPSHWSPQATISYRVKPQLHGTSPCNTSHKHKHISPCFRHTSFNVDIFITLYSAEITKQIKYETHVHTDAKERSRFALSKLRAASVVVLHFRRRSTKTTHKNNNHYLIRTATFRRH
jgi:hypothetical protein